MKGARRLFLITVTLALLFEALPYSGDVLGVLGWYLHQDIKIWLPIGLPFSLVEIALISAAVLWLVRGRSGRREARVDRGRLTAPVVWFGVAVAIGVLWGLSRGGDNLTYALFEVRGFGLLIFTYFLVGIFLRDDQDLSQLIWCILIACAGLAIENTYRYFFVLGSSVTSDLSFEHEDSVVLGFGAVLCVAILAFGGTRAQRWVSAALFPFIVVCLALMQRRAAWLVLAVGLIVLAVVVYRLRPKTFWRVVPLVAVVVTLYLGVFWNNQGTFGQPARAIRSQFSPDPRDASSDIYRTIEHLDIVANIASSRILGLGFGQQFIFYAGLPDLSFWQFWHYETHNSVLWLWMDGGIPVFFTFVWLAGSALTTGGQELASRREAWSLLQLRLNRPKRRERHLASLEAAHANKWGVVVQATPEDVAPRLRSRSSALKRRETRQKSGQYSGSTALMAAAVCLIPMQFLYSYVDLGLISGRDMLLYGLVLGIVGRSFAPKPPRTRRNRRGRGSGISSTAIASHTPLAETPQALVATGPEERR